MSNKVEKWIDAKKKYSISDKHIQMARELGLNMIKESLVQLGNICHDDTILIEE
jgi:hypothetical protein